MGPGILSSERAVGELEETSPAHGTALGRILAVDADADIRQYIRHTLGAQWTVRTVSDGPSALHAVLENPPELVLLAAALPTMSGLEVLRRLHGNPATGAMPVIMVYAGAAEAASADWLPSGAADYITKPFVAAALLARVATQVAAARARSTAEAAVRQRDDFVARVIHDLRHPLASLNWHTEIYRRRSAHRQSPNADDLAEFLSAVELTRTSLSTQLDALYDAMQLQSGQAIFLHRESTNLVDLARAVTHEFEDRAAPCQLRFASSAAELTGLWDAPRLERVLRNLVSNAIRYSPAGGDITVRVAQQGSEAIVSVEDHGLSIPSVDLPCVFEAKGIVEQHHGTISVVSNEGAGSTFTVRLPLAD